jgi:hypothetical protein
MTATLPRRRGGAQEWGGDAVKHGQGRGYGPAGPDQGSPEPRPGSTAEQANLNAAASEGGKGVGNLYCQYGGFGGFMVVHDEGMVPDTFSASQLRHSHATELVNGGVSLATIRRRLGHKNLQTTLRYAEQSDATADAEMRAWRRKQDRSC